MVIELELLLCIYEYILLISLFIPHHFTMFATRFTFSVQSLSAVRTFRAKVPSFCAENGKILIEIILGIMIYLFWYLVFCDNYLLSHS